MRVRAKAPVHLMAFSVRSLALNFSFQVEMMVANTSW